MADGGAELRGFGPLCVRACVRQCVQVRMWTVTHILVHKLYIGRAVLKHSSLLKHS